MDVISLIPSPDPIPVHWVWLNILLLVTFFLHLLCMNAMLGMGVIALVQSIFRTSRAEENARKISATLPYAIAFTVNMGVAPLLFIQVLFGQFIYTSSVMMAVFWLSIVVLLIVAYYSAYLYYYRFDALGPARVFFLVLSVAFLLVIAFFFSNNMTLMLAPENWVRYFDAPEGRLLNLSEPTLIPRYLHMVLSAIAVGGLFLAVAWEMRSRGGRHTFHYHVNQGLRWFTGATLAQFLVGTWWLMALPRHLARLFMGGSAAATAFFVLGILGAILSLVFAVKGRPKPCAAATLLTVLFMVLMRDLLRSASLEPYFTLSMLETVPQYSSLALFLVFLAVGAAAVVYMLRLAFGKNPEAVS